MNPQADPLTQLRDIHLPEPVPLWPPAPGWWLLGVVAILVVIAGWWAYRRRFSPVRRTALRELDDDLAAFRRHGDGQAFATQLSRLLRRYAVARFPHAEVAGLSGEAWLRFLDMTGGNGGFRNGPGRVLISAPYRPGTPVDVAVLHRLARDWIRHSRPIDTGGTHA